MDDHIVSGLVGSDKLTKEPTLAYASTPDTSKENSYDILISGAVASANYKIIYINGVLNIVDKTCDKGITCPLNLFNDLNSFAWYHDGVHFCIETGLMNGITSTEGPALAPKTFATRAQIATIFQRFCEDVSGK